MQAVLFPTVLSLASLSLRLSSISDELLTDFTEREFFTETLALDLFAFFLKKGCLTEFGTRAFDDEDSDTATEDTATIGCVDV